MQKVSIDVISDVVCPWCFLGKRRLDKAIAAVPEIEVEVNFRPFFLDPTIPAEGLDRKAYMLAKFGPERLKTIHDPLLAAGKEDGIAYAFDKISRTPSSLNAHRLLRWSHLIGSQRTVAEALFTAYWCWGQDISNIDVLKTIAIVNGLNGPEIAEELATDRDSQQVMEEASLAQQIGVTGVPTFVVNRKYGATGAQPSASLAELIRKVASEEVAPDENPSLYRT
jgi:predicted DsbA family dithiol-disulfide isomerase